MAGTTSNVLATLFFGLAFLWFLVACLYACSVILFLRMRREGRFLNVSIDDPTFGRYYFCGDRFYLPMGFIFRRFIVQYRNEQERKKNKGRNITKSERRKAMEILLSGLKTKPDLNESINTDKSDSASDNDEEMGDPSAPLEDNLEGTSNEDLDENVCSICLGPYPNESSAWMSPVCNHQFHRECLLNWLSQPRKTECPCCRENFVEEDDVWKTIKRLRKNASGSTEEPVAKPDPPVDVAIIMPVDVTEAEVLSDDSTSEEV